MIDLERLRFLFLGVPFAELSGLESLSRINTSSSSSSLSEVSLCRGKHITCGLLACTHSLLPTACHRGIFIFAGFGFLIKRGGGEKSSGESSSSDVSSDTI